MTTRPRMTLGAKKEKLQEDGIGQMMEDLTMEQSEPLNYNDPTSRGKCDKLRAQILSGLRKVYSQDELQHDEQSKGRLPTLAYGDVANDVSISSVGAHEKTKKDFGKRVYRENFPSEVGELHKGMYSKKMMLPYSDRTRREVSLKLSAQVQEKDSIFSPRNELKRSGKLHMELRKPCIHYAPQPPTLSGVLPRPNGGRNAGGAASTARQPSTLVHHVQGFDRPPSSRAIIANNNASTQPISVAKIKVRECRTYDNFLIEVSPRHIPNGSDRLNRIYKTSMDDLKHLKAQPSGGSHQGFNARANTIK